jgi:hypothetical protein
VDERAGSGFMFGCGAADKDSAGAEPHRIHGFATRR